MHGCAPTHTHTLDVIPAFCSDSFFAFCLCCFAHCFCSLACSSLVCASLSISWFDLPAVDLQGLKCENGWHKQKKTDGNKQAKRGAPLFLWCCFICFDVWSAQLLCSYCMLFVALSLSLSLLLLACSFPHICLWSGKELLQKQPFRRTTSGFVTCQYQVQVPWTQSSLKTLNPEP